MRPTVLFSNEESAVKGTERHFLIWVEFDTKYDVTLHKTMSAKDG